MTKVYTSAVVLIPPEKIWDPIQEVREKYDRNFHRWMPHITLLYPFRPVKEYSNLERDFKQICSYLSSFDIILEHFEYFHHRKNNYTIWLNPEPKIAILNLQKKIQRISPDCNDVSLHKGGFVPHLSLGQIKGKEKLLEIIKQLQSHWKPLKFKVKNLFFISRENYKYSKFHIKKVIPLA